MSRSVAASRDIGACAKIRLPSPHISPPLYYARRSARCVGAYSLQPTRRSVSYAFAVFRSVAPSQRRLDALATNGCEKSGLGLGRGRRRAERQAGSTSVDAAGMAPGTLIGEVPRSPAADAATPGQGLACPARARQGGHVPAAPCTRAAGLSDFTVPKSATQSALRMSFTRPCASSSRIASTPRLAPRRSAAISSRWKPAATVFDQSRLATAQGGQKSWRRAFPGSGHARFTTPRAGKAPLREGFGAAGLGPPGSCRVAREQAAGVLFTAGLRPLN